MIRVRVDDFPNTKDAEQEKHSLAAFREFHRCLSECIGGKRYLLGVIPKRCDVDDVLFLRNETDCVIGMHGIYHDEAQLDIHGNEFPAYLSKRDICEYMMEAGAALQDAVGRVVDIYMPPRNKIDMKTWDAAQHAAFRLYTSGPETDSFVMKNSMGSWIDSRPPHEYGRTDEMFARESHRELCRFAQEGSDVVLTLHWTWETNIGLEHMRKFFAFIPKEYFKDFDL